MPPDRFQQIEDLYHAAHEATAEERAVLLAQSDPELRREVERLLGQHIGRPQCVTMQCMNSLFAGSDPQSAKIIRSWALIAGLALAGWTPVLAASISYSGNLRTDATFLSCGPGCTLGPGNSDGEFAQYAAVVRSFNVLQASGMTAITFGYGGGVNGVGTTIPQGGLEPYLSLFDGAGNFLASTFSGVTCPPGANTNSLSGQCYDVLLKGGNLAAGNYQIALSAFSNMSFAENLGAGALADGFTGLGNLFPSEDLHYAFDIILTPSASVPEPGSGTLVAGAGLLMWYLTTRNRKG